MLTYYVAEMGCDICNEVLPAGELWRRCNELKVATIQRLYNGAIVQVKLDVKS